MNKKILIKYVSDETGVTLEDAEIVVSVFLKGLFNAVIANDRVKIKGFGSFAKSKRKSYDTVDPRNGRDIHVEQRTRIRFIPSKEMKVKLLND
jgi:nucleoid DNA-binding protein